MAELSNSTSHYQKLTNYKSSTASCWHKTWPIRTFCHICIQNIVNVEARTGKWWLEGQWQCWESHIQGKSCMWWVFIGKEKAKLHIMCLFPWLDSPESRLCVIEPLATPEQWWICAFGLINWSNKQKLDRCGSNISSIAFSVIQYSVSTQTCNINSLDFFC